MTVTYDAEIVTFDGVDLMVRAGTYDAEMAREIFEDRYYTVDGWDIPTDATVLDIGGGIGAFAVFAASHGAATVHSFEPIPESFDLLERNAAPFPGVHPQRAAVATAEGPVKMSGFHPMDDGTVNTGLPAITEDGTIDAWAVSVHNVLALADRWDVVKVDIEGYEYELLAAVTDDEFASIDMLTMEFHHDDEGTCLQRGHDLGSFLESKGFHVEVCWAWGLQGRLRARR